MSVSRQFVACKFRAEDTRTYTYHNDGEPVAVGDLVKVADARSDGWKKVEVVEITNAQPKFETKAILGKYELEEAAAASEELEASQ